VYKEILPDDWNLEPFIEWDYFTEDKTKVTEKYRYIVKDLTQLEEVFKYYDRYL